MSGKKARGRNGVFAAWKRTSSHASGQLCGTWGDRFQRPPPSSSDPPTNSPAARQSASAGAHNACASGRSEGDPGSYRREVGKAVTANAAAPRIVRLSNGLTVAVQPMAGVETLAVGLYADCGSRHEEAGLNGVAHLMEHMVFKGAGSRSAREIAEAVEDVRSEEHTS